jgi:hypothetical protein
MLQPWCPGFNPRKPEKMKMLIWVTLKDVPGEYRSSVLEIAESLGPVLGKNRGNLHYNDQKFCVALTAGDPFPIKIEVVNLVNGKISHIAVDYNNLPIRCRHCLATSHLVKECTVLTGKAQREGSVAEAEEKELTNKRNKSREESVELMEESLAVAREGRRKSQQHEEGNGSESREHNGRTAQP